MRRPRLPSSKAKVNKLVRLLQGRRRALVLVHDNPDPDAMAAALCLSRLIEALLPTKPRIVYGGAIGREDNRNMVRAIPIPLWPVENVEFSADDAVIMVDTQPSFANHSLPADTPVLAVVDHHALRRPLDAPLVDVRPTYGASTTIGTEYLVSARVGIPRSLATAICYGISTETQDLGREAAPADMAAFLEAFPLADLPLLGRLQHPARSVSYFAELDRALHVARVHDAVAVCHLGQIAGAETAAEMADVLAGVEGANWVLCTGQFGGTLVMSVRTSDRDARAAELLRSVIAGLGLAGGHGMIAGGGVKLMAGADPARLQLTLTRRFLDALGYDPDVELKPLMGLPDVYAGDEPPKEGGGEDEGSSDP